MRIYLKIFKDKNFGNYITDILLITTNKLKVSDLKRIIYQRYGIEKSIQRLIINLNDKTPVTMTDEFPLFFFKIKEKSTIYVEILEKPKANEDEILKKVKKREGKSKFLKKLNIFKTRPNLDTIKESAIEDMDDNTEIKSRSYTNNSPKNYIKNDNDNDNFIFKDNINNTFNKTIKDRFINSILNNKLNEFRDIIKIYNESIDINEPIGKTKQYSAVHFASMYEYCEMMDDLIYKYHADVNLISLDGWSPLHLCAYKGNLKIAQILLDYKKTNADLLLPKLGTALHCACKQNNFKMAALLMHRCNPSIKNNNELLPIDLTTDLNIKKLINKSQNKEDNIFDISLNKTIKTEVSVDLTKGQLKKFKFLGNLPYVPVWPERFTGYVYKKGKFFSYYNLRYVEINGVKNLFIRFLSKDDYPTKPKEVAFLRDIKNCKKKDEGGKYFIEINLSKKETHLYRFDTLKTRDIWLEELEKSINYTKFWIKYEEKYPDIYSYLSTLKQDIFEIDYLSGSVKKLEINKNNNNTTINNNTTLRANSAILSKNNTFKTNVIKIEDSIYINNSLFNNSNVNADSFDIKNVLFSGYFGQVVRAKFKLNDEIYLMKIINKDYLIKNNRLKYIIEEYKLLKELVSPFITTLHHSFQTSDKLYFVFDYCKGGDLNFHLMHNLFEEYEARFYIAEIILAIEYLHKNNMVFQNLNAEHILISNDGHIKLADMGLIKEAIQNGIYKNYISDNNINKDSGNKKRGAGRSSDIFGIGSILYEMICGSPPFYTNFKNDNKNEESELLFPNYFSKELKDLLSKLLLKEPTKRLGVMNKTVLKNHSWFKDFEWDKLYRKGINPPLSLVSMKKNIENKKYINKEEKEIFINNDEMNLNKNEIINIDNIPDNKKMQFIFDKSENNEII